MKLRRPSPALVISCIALVVACTGTAVGATIITASSQIKNGAVTSGDIKNGSVQGADIKDGTITQNKLRTPAAAGGAAPAFHAVRHTGPEGLPGNVVSRVATLNVPAGAYVVTAKTVMSAILEPQSPLGGLIQTGLAIGGNCRLDTGAESDQAFANIAVNQRQTPATLNTQTSATVAGPTDFNLECTAGVPFRLSETSIIATRVSSIALTSIPQS
jgi:hypothetical protein